MNRIAIVVITLAVVAGSVPAAATLSGAQATPEDGPAPGAAFAGVVDVQQAEVDSEVAKRSLERQFAAAESNSSKARIVAEQQGRLQERLTELEAEKTRLDRAHENGSIGQAQYQARLAALAAQIRAVERQADQTATVADSLPEEALRGQGANVSQVRSVAQQANRTGGGEMAEAARAIAGEDVGNGLGPPNGSARGPPNDAAVGPRDGESPSDRSRPNQNDSTIGPPDGSSQDAQNRTVNRSSPGSGDKPVTGDSPANSTDGSNETVGAGSQAPNDGNEAPTDSNQEPNDGDEVPYDGSQAPNGTTGAPNSSTAGTPTPGTDDPEAGNGSAVGDGEAPQNGTTTVTAMTTP